MVRGINDLGSRVRIGLGSDWHIGVTKERAVRDCLADLKLKSPDVLALLGDFSGGHWGFRGVRQCINLARAEFPDTPIVATLGNHDYWVRGDKRRGGYDGPGGGDPNEWKFRNPRLSEWNENYDKIVEFLKEKGVHFLDEDGLWRDARWPGVVLFGHTGWYRTKDRTTNDHRMMPIGVEGDTEAYMYNRAYKAVCNQVDALQPTDTVRIFCSHMPVVYPLGLRGNDHRLGGSEGIGNMLGEQYDVRYFLNGHCHQHWEHHPRYESGSDYRKPKAIIVEVYDGAPASGRPTPEPQDNEPQDAEGE